MAYLLLSRDIISDVQSAPQTFTSWDKCMQKAYCKWPAIVGIVVGSLILLSLIWCFARCLCCGAELCSCCCGGCCGSRRDRPSRHKDEYSPMPPAPYGGYQPTPAPMAYGNMNTPQFATFDVSSGKKINEDSLPPMPSWDTAPKRRVEEPNEPAPQAHNGDLEMGRLDTQPQLMRGGYNSVPNGPPSPMSHHPQQEYMANTGMSQAYHSDLGAQRMNSHNAGYDRFQSVPLSPPPTYRSNSNAPSVASDKFMAGAASPSPEDFSRQRQPSYQYRQPSYHHQQASSYAPSTMSTRYEAPTDYAPSRMNNSSPYNEQPQYQARPPSFSRKPVNGSYREV